MKTNIKRFILFQNNITLVNKITNKIYLFTLILLQH
jgi:hypothetical protein